MQVSLARLTGAALLLVLTTSAGAASYQAVQMDKSSVTFAYKQMGVSVDGRFKRFAPQIRFDPARPDQARAVIDIELASIDAGSADADQEVKGKSWFNTAAFPKASFSATQIRPTGPNQFEVTGTLTLKGQPREVRFPLRLAPSGKQAVFTGGFTLKRADFGVGEGMWSKFDVVANEVQVNFQLTATESP